jgi:hypothetical protein
MGSVARSNAVVAQVIIGVNGIGRVVVEDTRAVLNTPCGVVPGLVHAVSTRVKLTGNLRRLDAHTTNNGIGSIGTVGSNTVAASVLDVRSRVGGGTSGREVVGTGAILKTRHGVDSGSTDALAAVIVRGSATIGTSAVLDADEWIRRTESNAVTAKIVDLFGGLRNRSGRVVPAAIALLHTAVRVRVGIINKSNTVIALVQAHGRRVGSGWVTVAHDVARSTGGVAQVLRAFVLAEDEAGSTRAVAAWVLLAVCAKADTARVLL